MTVSEVEAGHVATLWFDGATLKKEVWAEVLLVLATDELLAKPAALSLEVELEQCIKDGFNRVHAAGEHFAVELPMLGRVSTSNQWFDRMRQEYGVASWSQRPTQYGTAWFEWYYSNSKP